MIGHLLRRAHAAIREHLKRTTRSTHWRTVEKHFLIKNPCCAACGSTKHVQVHHKKPFNLHPELELDEANLIPLCMDTEECHLAIGHGGSFRYYNPNVERDVVLYSTLPRVAQSNAFRARLSLVLP